MYEPVFGVAAVWIFLFGAFAVLYSTFFVATGPVTAGREFWWDELLRIVLDSSVERLELKREIFRAVERADLGRVAAERPRRGSG